jgi:hypothetical protein
MRCPLFSVDARICWWRWRYRARDRPPRHWYLTMCLYHRFVRLKGVVVGVHDPNTRHMSTTSAASEHFRYFMGISIISFNMPYHTSRSQKSCRQRNFLGQSSWRWRMVKCRFWAATQSPVVYVGLLVLCFIMAEKLAGAPLWWVVRDSKEKMTWGAIFPLYSISKKYFL